MSDTDQVYDAVVSAWERAGLARRQVFATPGWERAQAAVKRYCEGVGSPITMGPGYGDTWFNWLHILSHHLDERGHCLPHAKLELQLTELAIASLKGGSDLTDAQQA